MKNILLLAHDDAGQEARLQAALDLARALDGHLVCLDVAQVPALAGDYFGAAEGALLEAEREREIANQARLADRLEGEDVPWELREATGDIPDCMIEEAGLADLVVVNRRLDEDAFPDMRAIASSVVLKAGKPVVAVAEDDRGFDVHGTALVAWNGSRPVMNAIVAAVPLLKLAGSVILFEIADGLRRAPAEDAARYLSRHGVHATVDRIDNRTTAPSDLIRDACASLQPGYCVMGAYGHAQLREAIFGGVTRSMLSDSPVPLVIAH